MQHTVNTAQGPAASRLPPGSAIIWRRGLDANLSPLRDILGVSLPSPSHVICRGLPFDPGAGHLSASFPAHSAGRELGGTCWKGCPQRTLVSVCISTAHRGPGPSLPASQWGQWVTSICTGDSGPQAEAEDTAVVMPAGGSLTWKLPPRLLLLYGVGWVPVLSLQGHALPSAGPSVLPRLAPQLGEGSSSCPLNMS